MHSRHGKKLSSIFTIERSNGEPKKEKEYDKKS